MAVERDTEDDLLIRACELFLEEEGRPPVSDVAHQLGEEFGEPVSRERVYRLLSEARRRGILRFRVRGENQLQQAIAAKYDLPPERLHVLGVRGPSAVAQVASAAAEFTVDRILEIKRGQTRVRLGLGGGRTMMHYSRELAAALLSRTGIPKLGLHALSSGFNVYEPRTAPVSFFGHFAEVPTDIEYVGLFSEAVVDAGDYDAVKEAFGVKESFDEKDKIDIIVTSLADARDRHGSLNDVSVGVNRREELRANEWVGDCAYLPYSNEGPIELVNGKRAVTLFELRELAYRVEQGKEVLLVAGPCPACGEDRGEALRPLLARPELRVWSHVFLDVGAAQAVLR